MIKNSIKVFATDRLKV